MFSIRANNLTLDLLPDQPPVFEKSAARFGSIESREGLKSVDFNIPFSVTNFKALGFAIRPGVRGLKPAIGETPSPFVRIPAMVEDSGQIFSIGFLQIYRVNWADETVSITFFGDSSGWYADIQGLSIRDLDLKVWDHVWDTTNILAGQSTTDGWYYPIIDYGSYDTQAETGPLNTYVEDWFYGFYIHTLIRKIFDSIGYKISGNYLNSPRYKREFIPFSGDNLKKSPAQRELADLNGYLDFFSDTYDAPNTSTDTTYLDLSSLFPELTFTAVSTIAQLDITLNFGLFTEAIRTNFSMGTISIGCEILKNGTPISTIGGIASYLGDGTDSNNDTVLIEDVTSVVPGDIIRVRLVFNTGGFAAGVSAASMQADISNLIFTCSTSELVYPGDEIDVAYNLPDITQADLLLDIAVRHGLLFSTDSSTKTVQFWPFSEIISRKVPEYAIDWSDRVTLNDIRQMDYSELTQDYFRKSWVKFKEDGGDDILKSYSEKYGNGIGDGYLTIDNNWLEAEGVVYTSVFSATSMNFVKHGQIYVASIPHYSSNYTNFEDTSTSEPRVLLAIPDLSYISFTRVVRIYLEGVDMGDNIGWAYFVKGPFRQGTFTDSIDRIQDGLSFMNPTVSPPDNTLSAFNTEYFILERILNESRYLKVSIRLWSHEFRQLDFSRPVYISTDGFAGYYLVERIEGYINAQNFCDVYLIGI